MLADCFSPGQLALMAAVLTPVVTAIGILYRDGLKSRDSQIASLDNQIVYMKSELAEAHDRYRQGAQVMVEAQSLVRETVSSGKRR